GLMEEGTHLVRPAGGHVDQGTARLHLLTVMETLVIRAGHREESARGTSRRGARGKPDDWGQPGPGCDYGADSGSDGHGGDSQQAAGHGAQHGAATHARGRRLLEVGLVRLAWRQQSDVRSRNTALDQPVDGALRLLLVPEQTEHRRFGVFSHESVSTAVRCRKASLRSAGA